MIGEPDASVRVVLASARGTHGLSQDAIGVDGWALSGATPRLLEVSVRLVQRGPLAIALADCPNSRPGDIRSARIAAAELTNPSDDGPSDLSEAFRRADRAIHATTTDKQREVRCAAAVLLVSADGSIAVGNIGDVRAYRLVDGYAGELTVDDRSVAREQVAGRRATVRGLGSGRTGDADPHTYRFRAVSGDRLLLCTDGFNNAVKLSSVRIPVEDARSVAARLMRVALDDRRADNVTLVVVELGGIR